MGEISKVHFNESRQKLGNMCNNFAIYRYLTSQLRINYCFEEGLSKELHE